MLEARHLDRLHRRSARVALYGSLVLTGVMAVMLFSVARAAFVRDRVNLAKSQAWAEVDWADRREVQLLQQYLQIDTNAIDGDIVAGAEFLARQLEAAGLETHVERLGDGYANVWGILEGEDPGALVLHSHIDVEPIRHPERWKVGPFSGKIDPPWIYGRGAFDMKSVTIAQLVAVLNLADSGKKPARSVIFLATGSEERGSDLGARWVLRQHPELAQRFWAVLTEGGVVEAIDAERGKYWGTEVGQKQYSDLEVCAPDEKQLKILRRLIYRQPKLVDDLRLLPEIAEMLSAYAHTRDDKALRERLEHPERLLTDALAYARLPGYLEAMFRPEAHPFPPERVEGGGYRMMVKLHVLPGDDPAEARKIVVPDWMLWGLDWTLNVTPSADHGSPTSHPVFQQIQGLLHERYPKIPSGPFFLPRTATDSRYFRLAGIPSYGFSPFFILTPDTLTGANPNERIALPGYSEGVSLYSELVQRLSLGSIEP